MAFRSAGTLLTEFNAAYVPPALMPGYKGHVPRVAFSFGSTYGTSTFEYFQDQRSAALGQRHTPPCNGGHFPTIFSPSSNLVPSHCSHTRPLRLRMPTYTRFNLDSDRSAELACFYQMAQEHRKFYGDKTGMVPPVPYFLRPVREQDRYPIPTDLPPLSPKDKWHLLRVSPENLKTYQVFPSGKRVSTQERQRRDSYFEFRA